MGSHFYTSRNRIGGIKIFNFLVFKIEHQNIKNSILYNITFHKQNDR